MKKSLFFIILFLLVVLANCATEQTIFGQPTILEQECDAPIWNVGDSWRHRYSNMKEGQYTVERVEEGSYVVDDYYGGYKKYFDKKTLRLVAQTDPKGAKKPVDSGQFIDFPIHIGKTWKKMFTATPAGGQSSVDINYVNEYKVISYEDVTVPAGTFKAFQIEMKQTNYGGKFAYGKVYSWYSPEVKYIIKTEYENIPYWRGTLNSYLIKFNLKDKQSSPPEIKSSAEKVDTTPKPQTFLPETPKISAPALNIEAQAQAQTQAQTQTFSTLIGVVTEVKSRWLGVRSDTGDVVQIRVGTSTVYPNRIPFEGDNVKVEYLISRGVHIGYAVTVLERAKKPVESQPQLPPGLPPEISVFVGKWEGSWDNRKDLSFSLTISNINLEVVEVKYQSNDLNFSEKAKVISGEKPKIQWLIYEKVVQAIPGGAMPIWFTFEMQREGTLKGILDDTSVRKPVTRKAVLRRVD